MSLKNKLAIVIPAYKISFFEESLKSIANQTNKEFTLYIGDDASPSNLTDIIDLYKNKINIVYTRFDENLGGKDLVAHWNRCINMTQDEEWIWLFSDDDIMDERCVELFYEHTKNNKDHDFLHFDIQIINEKSENIFKTKEFFPNCSAVDYFANAITGKIYSCVVEYIFKRELFEKVNGFEKFDLAWSSDTATWMKMAIYNGINTIEGAKVKWRVSTLNISAISNNKDIVIRKINAAIKYLNWAKVFFKQNGLVDSTTEIQKVRWLMVSIVYTSVLSYREKYRIIISSLEDLNIKNKKYSILFFWMFEECKRNIKSAISYKG